MNTTPLTTIDPIALAEAKTNIQGQPDLGIVTYGVELAWQGGTRAIAKALPLHMGQEWIDRPFTWTVDEPQALLGSNQGPTPQEYLMSGVGACILVGFTVNAAILGIPIRQLTVSITGSLNLAGFLDLDPHAPVEMLGIQYKISVDSDASPEQLALLHDKAVNFSPNAMTVAKGIPLSGSLEQIATVREPVLTHV
ncbi:OsmC family protein [Synechocystis sp. LKSZ1]|uniref:OsmC family protein n=1 Tax=Synechocystis sp. LKSZ1 TaxID=3144951 RepID=UPI00336BEE3B